MDIDGNNQTRLTNNTRFDVYPQFSPDGSQIVYQVVREDDWEIYIMDDDGNNKINLTKDPSYDSFPQFQPRP